MPNRRPASLFLTLGFLGASLVFAQNVLPNPEFNTEIAPWVSNNNPESWDDADGRGCPGSGAFEVICNFADAIVNGLCLPYSAPTAHLSFRLGSSADVPGSEGFGYYVSMYSDTNCESDILGFPIYVGFQGVNIPTVFSTYNLPQTLSVGTQSIRVAFDFSDMNCQPADGILLHLDSLYYGEADPILVHDFENGDFCPFTAGP